MSPTAKTILHVGAILAASFAAAAPKPEVGPPVCTITPTYAVNSQGLIDGTPFIGGIHINGSQGGQLNLDEQYSVGYTWTVGGDLGLDIDGESQSYGSFQSSAKGKKPFTEALPFQM